MVAHSKLIEVDKMLVVDNTLVVTLAEEGFGMSNHTEEASLSFTKTIVGQLLLHSKTDYAPVVFGKVVNKHLLDLAVLIAVEVPPLKILDPSMCLARFRFRFVAPLN